MKPLKERLPLIDAAIDELNGDLSKCDLYSLDQHTILWKRVGQDLFLLVHPMSVNALEHSSMSICTRDEFTQRAKELGYINGYKYGVEYETNGEKPDLPDDVVIDYMIAWHSGYKKWVNGSIVSSVSWFGVEKFRIVDERYKPKEQDMNDWYEKGYHPEVGTKVDYEGTEVEVVARDQKLPQVCVRHADGQISVLAIALLKPLRTETDEMVEQMHSDLRADGFEPDETDSDYFASLAKQGYRKIKPMSEEEFVTHFIDEKAARAVYRAGCRFLDKGE